MIKDVKKVVSGETYYTMFPEEVEAILAQLPADWVSTPDNERLWREYESLKCSKQEWETWYLHKRTLNDRAD